MNGQGYGLRVPGLVISPYARSGYVDHQQLSTDSYLRFIEDDFLRGARLDPRTDGRPDARPFVAEDAPGLGDLRTDFDFRQAASAPDAPAAPSTSRTGLRAGDVTVEPLCYRDATMSRILTVVAAQVRPVPFDAAATLQKFEEEVRMLRGAFPDADLYVFPELYLTGEHPFVHPPRGYDENAQPIPGPLTRAIGRIAKRAGRWIVAGSIVERDDDALYNTAVVFAPSGRLAARYRKVFTWRPFEPYAVGTEAPPVFSIPNVGKVGVMICYDGWFPEMARSLALRGAEVIAHPTLTTTPDREEELVLARANAITNQCYVINPNAVVTIGGGRSIGVDPEGRVLFEGGSGEEFIPEVLDLDRVHTVRRHGTRGLNRVLQHVRDAPRAAFGAYEELGRD